MRIHQATTTIETTNGKRQVIYSRNCKCKDDFMCVSCRNAIMTQSKEIRDKQSQVIETMLDNQLLETLQLREDYNSMSYSDY